MAHFATPFLVVNLGCEMVFVIDQRLKAQNISLKKSERVLTDIVTVLLHSKLLDELFIPQPVAEHSVVKQLLQDISTTSIMKLDDYSISKLWDLMTTIFKWQLIAATNSNQNIFEISRRHIRSAATLMPQYFPKFTFDQAMRRFDNLVQQLSDSDFISLTDTIIAWCSQYHTKISVLMRLGLQEKDGTFSKISTINPKILSNLGENIYQYDTKKSPEAQYHKCCLDSSEINCLLSSIEKICYRSKVELYLPMVFGSNQIKKKTIEIERDPLFQNISINIKTKSADLPFNPDLPKSPQDDLLKMLEDVSD